MESRSGVHRVVETRLWTDHQGTRPDSDETGRLLRKGTWRFVSPRPERRRARPVVQPGAGMGLDIGGVTRLLGQNVAEFATDDMAANDNILQTRLDSELGYGFGVFGGYGLQTFYGRFSLAAEGFRRYRVNWCLEFALSLNLSYEGERCDLANDAAVDNGNMLRSQLRV